MNRSKPAAHVAYVRVDGFIEATRRSRGGSATYHQWIIRC